MRDGEDDAARAEARALRALHAWPGLTWRSSTREALPELFDLLALIEEHEGRGERTSLAELYEDWDSPRSHTERDSLIGRDARGRVVAHAQARCLEESAPERRVMLFGEVAPHLRRRGLGRAILRWELAHGRAHERATRQAGGGPLAFHMWRDAGNEGAAALALAHGLPQVRRSSARTRMFVPGEALEAAPVAGVRLTRLTPELVARHSEELRQVHNEAFADHWGSLPLSRAQWQDAWTASASRIRWSFAAWESATGRAIGVALGAAYLQDWEARPYRAGYCAGLGVVRPWRRRGVARALLTAQMAAFREDGMDAAELAVDLESASGAHRIYDRLGFRETSAQVLHRREERPA